MQRQVWTADADNLAAEPGAYLLLLRLTAPVALPPRFGGELGRGVYVYAGSAWGPGGVRARCRRHFRPDKPPRWHVDWLRAGASDYRAAAFYGARECDLMDRVIAAGGSQPIRGFGSSDCRRCTSHLAVLDIAWSPALVDRI